MKPKLLFTRFALFLVFLLLALTACQKPSPPADQASPEPDDPYENTPADQCLFDFDYEMISSSPRRVDIMTYLTNIADEDYVMWYRGSSTKPVPVARATLYTESEGEVYRQYGMYVYACDIVEYWAVLESGACNKKAVFFLFPADAPAGTYHLTLSYLGQEKTFENVFVLSAEE